MLSVCVWIEQSSWTWYQIDEKQCNATQLKHIFLISVTWIELNECKCKCNSVCQINVESNEMISREKKSSLFDHNMRLDCFLFAWLLFEPIEWDKSQKLHIAFHWFLFASVFAFFVFRLNQWQKWNIRWKCCCYCPLICCAFPMCAPPAFPRNRKKIMG